MECYGYLRDIQDLLADGKTPDEQRLRLHIPWTGAEITYHPITTKNKIRLHQFGANILQGIFAGYALNAGGGWTGDPLFFTPCRDVHDECVCNMNGQCGRERNKKKGTEA